MSKLQDLARKRNSAFGRIKGLRNNIRGMLSDKGKFLTEDERLPLLEAENQFDRILSSWDEKWEQIKSDL